MIKIIYLPVVNAMNSIASKTYCLLLTTLLLLPIFSFAQTDQQAQVFDYSCADKPLVDVLLELSKLSSRSIAFDAKQFEKQRTSIDVQSKPLIAILEELLIGTDFECIVTGKSIRLKKIKYFTISGFVEDQQSGESLPFASVVDVNTGKGVVCNGYGFFSLPVKAGKLNLEISFVGYKTFSFREEIKENVQQKFSLQPGNYLTAIEVVESLDDDGLMASTHSYKRFSGKKIQSVPALGGESDLFGYLQSLPGVTTGADGIGGLHVRGGNADQNLTLLDGVPIFNPLHSLGLFSIFKTSAIKSVTFQNSGFSAKYGGHLSSVLDIQTKEGNVKSFESAVELSTVASSVTLQAPIGKDKGGLMVSARRTHLDSFIKKRSKFDKSFNLSEGESQYYFYDINAKAHFNLGARDKIFFSVYSGQDNFRDELSYQISEEEFYEYYYGEPAEINFASKQLINWGNKIGSLRWNRSIGNRVFVNTTLTASQFQYQSYNAYNSSEKTDSYEFRMDYYSRFFSEILDFRLKTDVDFYVNEKHHLSFGANVLNRQFKPGSISETGVIIDRELEAEELREHFDDVLSDTHFDSRQLDVYFQDNITFSEKLKANLGLRQAVYFSNGTPYFSTQPRIRLDWTTSKKVAWYLSASRMTQFLHQLSTTNSGLPNDQWVPATDSIGPQNNYEVAFGGAFQLSKRLGFSLAAYHKRMSGLLRFKGDASLPGLFENDPLFWQTEVDTELGRANGIESHLTWKGKSSQWSLAYTISEAHRGGSSTFEQFFPYRYHRPHQLHLSLIQRINEKWEILSQFQYLSGQRQTLLATDEPFAPLENISQPLTSAKSSINGYQLPAYVRWDISGSFSWGKGKSQHKILLGVYNITNRSNPIYTYILEDSYFEFEDEYINQRGLSILPVLNYSWNFKS